MSKQLICTARRILRPTISILVGNSSNRGTLDGFRRAAEAFRKAVELDPRYAAAYAELAIAESFVADSTGDAAGQQQALAAADKAVELAPDDADAYATRGYMRLRRTWDWSGAQADLEKALTSIRPTAAAVAIRYAAG